METAIEAQPRGPSFVNADKAVEACVRRLGDLGMDRKTALEKIHETLSKVLVELGSIAMGNTSYLRNMLLGADMKLRAEQPYAIDPGKTHDDI